MNNTSTVSSAPYLHWTQRSTELQEEISDSFEYLTKATRSGWGLFNGSDGYNLCGVDEYALMKRIILEAPKEQKEFYALDIGAGNFQWGKGLAEYLNQQPGPRNTLKSTSSEFEERAILENE